MIPRVVLRYDAGLSGYGTWRMLLDGGGVEIKARIGAIGVSCKIELRYRLRDAREWPRAAFVRPFDSECTIWLTGPVDLGGEWLRRELQLEQAPEHVATTMRTW